MVALRDPLGIAPDIVALPPDYFYLLTFFDGKSSYLDAQTAFVQRHGTLLYSGQIEEIVRKLDENYLLENARFQERMERARQEFRRLSVRPATCTPNAYSADPEECAQQFEEFLAPARKEVGAVAEGLSAMVVPHIDVARGKEAYGAGYALVEKVSDVDVFVIFGTSHGGMEGLFTLTEKDWITPHGRVRADRAIIDEVKGRSESDFLSEEYAHKAEHSIEIQVAILSYLRRGGPTFRIVPILCGSFDRFIGEGRRPGEDAQFQDFMLTLEEALAADNRRRMYLAGADLSHIGPRFGDAEPLTKGVLEGAERADKESLVHLATGDADAFFDSVAAAQESRRVCGLSPIYSMLHAARPKTGRILKYEQWVEEDGRSSVSFSSVALYG